MDSVRVMVGSAGVMVERTEKQRALSPGHMAVG